MNALKYLLSLTLPVLVFMAFTFQGIWVWIPLIYSFGFIPLLELGLSPDSRNLSAAEEAVRKKDPLFDWIIYVYGWSPLRLAGIFSYPCFKLHSFTVAEWIGIIALSMGLMCGTYGINLGT